MHPGSRQLGTVRVLFAALAASVLIFSAFVSLRYSTVQAQSSEPKQLAVYSPRTTYAIPMLDVRGQTYIGLVDLLEPLGSIEAKPDGKKYKLKFTTPGARQQELEFHDGKDGGKIRGDKIKLAANFVLQNERGYIPLASANEVLVRLGFQPVELRPAAQRLFIGNVVERFSLDLKKGTPSRLVISFPAPVNPTIATEPGRVRLTFKREPVSGPAEHVTYDDPMIKGATFSEHDGIAELDIAAGAPLMANFADDRKTIIVSGAPGPQTVPMPVPAPETSILTTPKVMPPPVPRPRFLVLIDPAHGGTEIGAAITPELPEKDVVLALARRVQHELGNRGIAAWLLRNGDYAIGLDQRAISANAARPALYIALHAANTGKGVHVYTAMVGPEDLSPRDFLPWDTVQAAFTDLSGSVAGSVSAELESRALPNLTLTAPLRPLNNIAAPAIAVEIAPPGANVSDIASPEYQEQVAQSIAAGVAAVRAKLPEVNR